MAGKIVINCWEYSKAKGGELLTLLAIADAANENGYCYPGSIWLGKMTRLSKRQIRRNVIELKRTNELWINERPGTSHQYIVLPGLTEDQFFTACVRHMKYSAEQTRAVWKAIVTRDIMSTPTPDIMSTPPDIMSTPTPDIMSTPPDIMSPDPILRYKEVWSDTLEILKDTLPLSTFERHFPYSQLLELNGTIATILLPIQGSVELVEARLNDKVKTALKYATNSEYDRVVYHEVAP